MKTENEIRMDYENARKTATAIEQVADELAKKCRQTACDSFDSLSSKWSGPAKDSFFTKANSVNNTANGIYDLLIKLAGQIRARAKRTYEAEMRNLAIALKRVY